MKKFLSILLAGAMLGVLSMVLTGCNVVTERKMKTMTEKALEEKYNEKFECIQVYGQNPSGASNAICYPVNDRALMFDATIYPDGTLGYDCYPNSIAAKYFSNEFDDALRDIWGRHFTYCYKRSGIIDDEETARKIMNGEFTLEYYFNHFKETYTDDNTMLAYYTICVDSSKINVSYDEEWDAISDALSGVYEIGLSYGTQLYFTVNIYFVPSDVYEECMNYFKDNAEVRSNLEEMIEGYPEREHHRQIVFDINSSENKFSPTKEEYIELRKDID